MLIKKPEDVKSSEITAKTQYASLKPYTVALVQVIANVQIVRRLQECWKYFNDLDPPKALTVALDSQFLHARAQGAGIDAENCRRAIPAMNHPIAFVQCS